jgi:hypothetical protein
VREIPNAGAWDGMGCHPLFVCRDWAELRADLDGLASFLVSITVVTDPFGIEDPSRLRDVSRISLSSSSNTSPSI